ncbi:cation:proton antiporter [Roseivirga sp.]|uniref:cation:proton antiporter domain-containing protein n=1 Tax=Roseivirga sp. TaxID=1964215 RepID=UPI002B272B87|nr:cation:proton antiporter [Roseivirga sp.]
MTFNQNTVLLLGGFAIVAVAAKQLAGFFTKIKLPFITGLLVIGLFSGPFIFNLLPKGAGNSLHFINDISLAFIAFAAAAELYLKEVRSQFNSIKWMTFGQLVVTFVVSSIVIYFMAGIIPFMSDLNAANKVAVSLLMATIFVARSPASAIAVITEMRAKGPFVRTAMGVTVVKDFLVILLFAICFSVSQALVNGDPLRLKFLLTLLAELTASFGLGFLVGKILTLLLKQRMHQHLKTTLILATGYGVYAFYYFVKSYTVEEFGKEFHLEPLLICIIGSFIVTNYSKFRYEFLKILEEIGPYVYIAFFTLTGISVSLDVFIELFGIAVLLFTLRLVTMVLGSFVGGALAGDSPLFRKIGWMPYVTQAGVGLGLATIVADAFPTWGSEFATVVVAVIVLNQFVGPPLFKWSINLVGEGHTRANIPQYDGVRDAFIVGFDSQSVALARQLKEHGWEAELVTRKEDLNVEDFPDLIIHQVKDFDLETFKGINVEKVEAIVLTLTDDENLGIAELIYQNVGTKDIVVRLNQRYNFEKFHKLGCLIVDPHTAMVSLMDHLVRSPQAATLLLGMKEGQDTMDIQVLNPNLRGIPLRELRLPADIIVLSVNRNGQSIITHGYTRLRIGDVLTIVGSKESLQKVTLKFDR